MLKIRFLWLGKTQLSWVEEGLEMYQRKLKPYAKITCQELKPASYSKGVVTQWQTQETQKVLSRIAPGELTVFLDENGRQMPSPKFAQWLESQMIQTSQITFVVGGAYGWDQTLLPAHVMKWSLSSLTLNHQMVRLFLMEQVYRAFTILRGESYHH